MKLYDQETKDLARSVQDVLEGKKPLKEMDPTKHVELNKETGMYCVYNKDGKKVKEFKSKEEADKYAIDNHDALMGETYTDIDGKQHKKVKAMHPVKKTVGPGADMAEDIEAAHEEALAIEEARQLKDPKKEVMVVKNGKVEVINKKDLKKFMAKGYGLAEDDVKEEEMSAKQKAYKKVFDAALKKFGVKSPAELEGDKKKEFFDLVDKNYDAGENETD
jgi:hypothetical protein|tara:strand:+ start:1634 stop:2290 length:657 start_codon:yes stop_codon:yes gene_type:complete